MNKSPVGAPCRHTHHRRLKFANHFSSITSPLIFSPTGTPAQTDAPAPVCLAFMIFFSRPPTSGTKMDDGQAPCFTPACMALPAPQQQANPAMEPGREIPAFFLSAGNTQGDHTANTLESVNMSLRKVKKNRGSFPGDEARLKLLQLTPRNISKKWPMLIKNW